MTQAKGKRAPQWAAQYLRRWWPKARAVTIGQRGTDITGTDGIVWEVKTPREFEPVDFVRQATKYAGGRLPIVVYFPNGVGEANTEFALAILPLYKLVEVLDDAGWTDTAKARADAS